MRSTRPRPTAGPALSRFGYTAGVGVDWALMQNVFLRAEYEYINFGSFYDLNDCTFRPVRLGAGVKF